MEKIPASENVIVMTGAGVGLCRTLRLTQNRGIGMTSLALIPDSETVSRIRGGKTVNCFVAGCLYKCIPARLLNQYGYFLILMSNGLQQRVPHGEFSRLELNGQR